MHDNESLIPAVRGVSIVTLKFIFKAIQIVTFFYFIFSSLLVCDCLDKDV